MPDVICADCTTELVTGLLAEPTAYGNEIRRERSYCPGCGPPGDATVVR